MRKKRSHHSEVYVIGMALLAFIVVGLAISFTIRSCTHPPKADPIEQLEELTEEIRIHHAEYTVSDWKKAYAQYKQISAEMEKHRYSDEEVEKIRQLEGECVGYFTKSAVKSLEGIGSEIKDFFDGFNKAIE